MNANRKHRQNPSRSSVARNRRNYHKNAARTRGTRTPPDARGPASREFLRNRHLGGRVTGRVRWLGYSKGLLLRRNASAKRTGRRRSNLRGRGISGARYDPTSEAVGAYDRRGWSFLSGSSVRRRSILSGGFER